MTRIQGAIVQIPKPPPNRTLKALESQRQSRKQREIQVHWRIAVFLNSISCLEVLRVIQLKANSQYCFYDSEKAVKLALYPNESIV